VEIVGRERIATGFDSKGAVRRDRGAKNGKGFDPQMNTDTHRLNCRPSTAAWHPCESVFICGPRHLLSSFSSPSRLRAASRWRLTLKLLDMGAATDRIALGSCPLQAMTLRFRLFAANP
jgi:hypothetical protein